MFSSAGLLLSSLCLLALLSLTRGFLNLKIKGDQVFQTLAPLKHATQSISKKGKQIQAIKAKGKTNRETYMTDISATLAALLHIQMPSGCIGKVIEEVEQ